MTSSRYLLLMILTKLLRGTENAIAIKMVKIAVHIDKCGLTVQNITFWESDCKFSTKGNTEKICAIHGIILLL